MNLRTAFFLFFLLSTTHVFGQGKTSIKLGILAFGTVNWELTALENENLINSSELQLEIQHVANPQAGKIALLSGAVDIIVSDWIWVSRQRSAGHDLTFYPYSGTSGALIVREDSNIRSLTDLKDIRLGIAGGELDKNWLLIQALVKQQYQFDLDESVEKVYGAPPLLNQQILRGKLDALINYWHYAARLESEGYRQIINGKEILAGLGIQPIPTLGYVFSESWGNEHQQAINTFLSATRQAKDLLCTSDPAWKKIAPLTKTKKDETLRILRSRYCEGLVTRWSNGEKQDAAKIFQLLKKVSNNRLTGASEELEPGTFWTTN